MEIENAQKIIKQVAEDLAISAIEKVRTQRGQWNFNELCVRLIDTINTENQVVIKEVTAFRKKTYVATLTQNNKVVCQLEQSNFKQLVLQVHNVLNFKR